ncbi:glycosyltransferase family 4 protein [Luethyella okanaganae]|uniref:D-inositol 3-phosphate glycosyltransferase n=1 Tax=Luethyella okanaganae TaxID=69372 RepID=A0ABW1V9T6_9MICO
MPEPRVAIAYDCLFPVNAGGGERVYRRMAELFAERGCSVDYVTRGQWAAGGAPTATFTIAPVWSGDIYDRNGTRTSASAVAFAFALFRHFRRHRRDYELVVVSALPVLNVFAVRLALLGSGHYIVVDWLEVWGWRKWRDYSGPLVGSVAAALQWFGLRLGQLHTVNSRFTRDRVRRYRAAADPIVLGLVDLVGEVPEAATDRSVDPYVLFVGRHVADKRLHLLPDALAEARRSIPDLRAVVVGTGPATEVVRARAAELGVEKAITFAGRVDDELLDGLFARALVLVNPSAREGFGLVVAEAAAHATPSVVVEGEDNAAAGLVVDGVNGFVATTIHPVVLGAAIVRAIRAGAELRASTRSWFLREREGHGLASSVDAILERYRSARAR